jgi:hypothetical protein
MRERRGYRRASLIMAPSITTPALTYFQSATSKLVEDDEIGVGEPRRDLAGFALPWASSSHSAHGTIWDARSSAGSATPVSGQRCFQYSSTLSANHVGVLRGFVSAYSQNEVRIGRFSPSWAYGRPGAVCEARKRADRGRA